MAADGFSGTGPEDFRAAHEERRADRSFNRLAEDYLSRLLRDIGLMLTYVTSNGIVVPDDLRRKIDALLTQTENGIDAPVPAYNEKPVP